jgi:hypothetical protein
MVVRRDANCRGIGDAGQPLAVNATSSSLTEEPAASDDATAGAFGQRSLGSSRPYPLPLKPSAETCLAAAEPARWCLRATSMPSALPSAPEWPRYCVTPPSSGTHPKRMATQHGVRYSE